jgi:hypothetical protein
MLSPFVQNKFEDVGPVRAIQAEGKSIPTKFFEKYERR